MKRQKIRTTPSLGTRKARISGELNGKNSFVIFDGTGLIEGRKLYRLARAVVDRFEEAETEEEEFWLEAVLL